MRHKRSLNKLALVTLLAFLPIACSPVQLREHKRAMIGGVGGAAAGGLLGAASGNTGTGALVGGAAGALIGEMTK